MKDRLFTYRILIIILLLLTGKDLNASPQRPDYLIYKGDTLPVYNLILEKYLTEINQTDKGSLFGLKFRDGASLNCWRGYQAIYKIENDSLFLTDIIECGELQYKKFIDKDESNRKITNIFKNQIKNGKVFIDWYSGNFSLPKSTILRWDGVFYTSFEKEILIKVDKGEIKYIKPIDNYIDNPNRINRRYNDTISNVLFERIKSKKLNWKKLDDCLCAEKYLVTINKNGKVTKVEMADYQSKDTINKYWDRKDYNLCVKSIYKAVKGLDFDVIKRMGEKISEKVYLEIWYEDKTGQIENWTR
jgi:hypothetical protein